MPLLNWDRRREKAASALSAKEIVFGLESELGAAGGTGERALPSEAGTRGKLFESCANPGCRTGWLHLWRSRSAPVVEGGWSCSSECTAALLTAALRREMSGNAGGPETHRHRIPLGLLMLQQGWINNEQLRAAVEQQKNSGGRLGYWLVRKQNVSEQLVARALGLQWSCPVLGMEFYDGEGLTSLVPRLFVDAFGALPLRVAAGKILYLGFEGRLDPVLALSLERMTGLRVESGIVSESEFRPAHTRLLGAKFPNAELIESASEQVLVEMLTKRLERVKPVECRVVRVHDCLWVRLWLRPQKGSLAKMDEVQDLICSVRQRVR
jgi:hypothetical protein